MVGGQGGGSIRGVELPLEGALPPVAPGGLPAAGGGREGEPGASTRLLRCRRALWSSSAARLRLAQLTRRATGRHGRLGSVDG